MRKNVRTKQTMTEVGVSSVSFFSSFSCSLDKFKATTGSIQLSLMRTSSVRISVIYH